MANPRETADGRDLTPLASEHEMNRHYRTWLAEMGRTAATPEEHFAYSCGWFDALQRDRDPGAADRDAVIAAAARQQPARPAGIGTTAADTLG